jgi:hypothetical protein
MEETLCVELRSDPDNWQNPEIRALNVEGEEIEIALAQA